MARVRLASWYDGHAPGETVEVPDDEVRPLRRDGRVSEVLAEAVPPPPAPTPREERPPQAGESRQRQRKTEKL